MKAHDPTLTIRSAAELHAPPSLRSGRSAAEVRILTVLGTARGTIPWRPDFGCEIQDLIGRPAHPAVLNEAEWRVREAVARWLPDLRVRECRATAVERGLAPRQGGAHVEVGLLALGGEAHLHVTLVVELDGSPLSMQLEMF